jgi:hypothetical protein
MEQNEKHNLFKKRWDRYRKMGAVKYGVFLGSLYALTLLLVSLLYDFNEGDLPFSEILTYIDGQLILKTTFFFVFGIAFGIYHFRKSETKYKANNF